jgi:hypothetical protein
MEMKTIILIILSIALIGSSIFAFYEKDRSNNIEVGRPVALHWACMDGCYNMQLVILNVTFIDIDNLEQKKFHDKCSDICYHQYFKQEEGEPLLDILKKAWQE